MENYAIIKIAHRQYIVEPNKVYTVDKFDGESGNKMELPVLLISQGGKLQIGNPVVEKAKVEIEIVEQGKGEKVTTRIYKAKSRYHKTTGHRKRVTTFKVLSF